MTPNGCKDVDPALEELRLLTSEEAAKLLSCSRRALDRWAAQGKIRQTKCGARFTRYAVGDVRRFIEKAQTSQGATS